MRVLIRIDIASSYRRAPGYRIFGGEIRSAANHRTVVGRCLINGPSDIDGGVTWMAAPWVQRLSLCGRACSLIGETRMSVLCRLSA